MKGGARMYESNAGDGKSFYVVIIVIAIAVGVGAVFSAVDHSNNTPHVLFCMVWAVAALVAFLAASVTLVRGK